MGAELFTIVPLFVLVLIVASSVFWDAVKPIVARLHAQLDSLGSGLEALLAEQQSVRKVQEEMLEEMKKLREELRVAREGGRAQGQLMGQ
ncbi:hypothetical protein JCM10213_001866 [Rhodosporidiobolus nylandii]